MDISVVIVSYNVKEFLRSAILSVEKALGHSSLEGEILVVDNNSGDGSAELVRTEFPTVRLWALKDNLGFGRANNVALREAQGDYMLILNPDTILGEETLEVMLNFMKQHPEAGLAGCKLLNGDGSFQLSCRRGFPTPWASFTKLFGLSKLFPNSKLFAQYNLTYLPVDQTYEVDALGGAFMMMSRAAFEATGGFDEQFFMYGEDLDLCYQVKKQGFKVFYVAETATIHFKGESTRRSALNEVKVFYEAMHIFVAKNYRVSILFTLMLRVGILLRSLLATVKKHRGAVGLILLDVATVAVSVLITSAIILGSPLGLPADDYPFALLAPPVIVVGVLMAMGTYSLEQRRSIRQVLTGMPAALILLSSLTYFFKEYASSRSLVLSLAGMTSILLIFQRYTLRFIDRLRFGGARTARPAMKRTLVVGTTVEAQRIGELLRRTQFVRYYQLVGFVDSTLAQVGTVLLEGIGIVGDTRMMAKIVRDEKISEVIFASDALPYSEMLVVMQRVSDENPTRIVNFNVIPTASDVLLGRKKIEVLAPAASEDSLPLITIHYNVQRFSHRILKRLLDLLLAPILIVAVGIVQLFRPNAMRGKFLDDCKKILRGDLSVVGVASPRTRLNPLAKSGLTSLAGITLGSLQQARLEDIEQLDLYYAQNHSLGMDLEIIFRSMLTR